jgi:endonuclease/exonuclease/phosphatase family metal-dependent hydrolase
MASGGCSESAGTGAVRETIRQNLAPRFAELKRFRSTREMEASDLYRELREPLARALDAIDCEDFRTADAPPRDWYRVLAWNIERGTQLARQIAALRTDEYLRLADIVLITEVDVGMSRSGNVDVIRVMARELGFAYAFAPCYLNLEKGSGLERQAAGDNELGLHGNAILSRYPIRAVHTIRLSNGIDKMAGVEKRLGSQRVIVAVVDLPGGPVTVVCAHLDVRARQRHRARQMRHILDGLRSHPRVIVGGDWNTNTYDGSSALHLIVGFARRVLMGVDNMIRNHFLHPERFFERHLFRLLEAEGYDFRQANRLGEQTASYDVVDPRHHLILREWLPGWCFAFIRWALRHHGGCCPMKLDWFATRGVRTANPTIVHEVRGGSGTLLSDHDAIGIDIRYFGD